VCVCVSVSVCVCVCVRARARVRACAHELTHSTNSTEVDAEEETSAAGTLKPYP
jgi:hypothetical protein